MELEEGSAASLTVIVLGAGASVACGYPAAANFFERLSTYGKSLDTEAAKLRIAIQHVVDRAADVEALTIDDLARLALLRRGGGMQNYDNAWRTASLARIVTDAFFLHLEREIPHGALEAFKGLWHEIIGPITDDLAHEFPQTRYRLVSFNYDRLAEIAFNRSFTGAGTAQYDIYSSTILNTGLNRDEGPKFRDGKFSFLKLHGSVGVCPFGPSENDRFFGHFFGHYAPLSQSSSPAVNDDTYFKDELDQHGLPVWKNLPLIVFPADKQRVEAGGEDYNFREYITAIRGQAAKIFAAATRIVVIGYSFQPADKQWLISLLRSAPEAKKIIFNPHAEQIVEYLRIFDELTNLHAIQGRW